MAWSGFTGDVSVFLKKRLGNYLNSLNVGQMSRATKLGYSVGGLKGGARGFRHWAIGGSTSETATRLGTMAGAGLILGGASSDPRGRDGSR